MIPRWLGRPLYGLLVFWPVGLLATIAGGFVAGGIGALAGLFVAAMIAATLVDGEP